MVWLFLIPSIPSVIGNFLLPLMIGARDLAFPRLNLAELVPLHRRRRAHAGGALPRRRRHRLDLLHAVLDDVLQQLRGADAGRRLHRRLLVDPHRPQLHRHGAHAARAGHGLVPAAALRLGDLRDQHHPGAGDAGAGDHAAAGGRRAAVPDRRLRSGARRRSAAVPAPVLVLLAPGRLHHGAAGDGRGQRDRPVLRAEAHLRLPLHGLRDPRHRRRSASWSGATTCSSAASR